MLKSHYSFIPDRSANSQAINLSGLQIKLDKFIGLKDKSLLAACRTLSTTHGLQEMAGKLLKALIAHVDDRGYIALNGTVRKQLATRMQSTDQVVVNQLKSLVDVNLLLKESRGHYYFNVFSAHDCRRLREGQYKNVRLVLDFQNGQYLPSYIMQVD